MLDHFASVHQCAWLQVDACTDQKFRVPFPLLSGCKLLAPECQLRLD